MDIEVTDVAPLLLRVSQAAGILGIGRSTAYELIAKGEIPTVHIGRSCRIPLTELEAYVRRLQGPAEPPRQ